jgi:RHS repeat-associated protein
MKRQPFGPRSTSPADYPGPTPGILLESSGRPHGGAAKALYLLLATLMALPPIAVASAVDRAIDAVPASASVPASNPGASTPVRLILQSTPRRTLSSTSDQGAPTPTPSLTLRVQGATTNATYLVQTSSNLTQWRTLLTVRPDAGNAIPAETLQPTQAVIFYRLLELAKPTHAPVPFASAGDLRGLDDPLGDTSPPSWPTGPNGRLTIGPSTGWTASWEPATDDVAVASYRIYLDDSLLAENLARTSWPLSGLPAGARGEMRVQALDTSANDSAILPLFLLPGDGLLAYADDNGRIFTLHARADGTFTAPAPLATLNINNRGIPIADFDRDGYLDLVTGGAQGDQLTPFFFRGRPDGTFEAPLPLPSPSGANGYMMDAAAGDFDCDGNPDLVFNGNSPSVYFYWGNGDGTFSLSTETWGDYGRGTDAGDLNEDGRPDIIRANLSGGLIRLFLSNGDRTFTETLPVGQTGSDPYGVVTGDFDEDGHLDVIANDSSSGDVSFFEGNGDGTFVYHGTHGRWAGLDPDNYAAMATWDYNSDGHLDFAQVTYSSQSLLYWTGVGDGSFVPDRLHLANGIGANVLGIASPPLPPRVDIGIIPRDPVVLANTPVTLLAIGPGAAPGDTYRWTFGDTAENPLAWTFDASSADLGPNVSHAYAGEGRYLARLWHTDSRGVNSCRGAWISVRGAPPTARPGGPYHFGETSANQGIWTASLDGSASSDDSGITDYRWDFGQGKTGTGATPQTTYTARGTYPVTLTVTDASGQTHIAATTVDIAGDGMPVARIDASTLAPEGPEPILWSASRSTDDRGIFQLRWWLPFPNRFDFSGSTLDTALWASAGTSQDDRLVVQGNGWSGAGFASVGLPLPRGLAFQGRIDTSPENSHSMVGFRSLANADRGYWRLVHALYFADGGLHIYEYGHSRGQVGSYERGQSYDFRIETKPGAGARYFVRRSGAEQTFQQVFESNDYADSLLGIGADVYSGTVGFDDFALFSPLQDFRAPVYPAGTVRLEVIDHALQTNSTAVAVTPIVASPPTAVLDGPSTIGETAAHNGVWTASFDGSASTDDHGIAAYEWEFGDGKSGTGPAVQTTYGAAGDYPVRLTVTDYAGQRNTAVKTVRVKGDGVPHPIIAGPDILPGTAATNFLWYGEWNGLGSTDDTGVHRYEWGFGDGTTANGPSVSHSYAGPGTFELTLTVYDHANQPASVTKSITAQVGAPPVPRISVSNPQPEGDEPVTLDARTSTDDRGIVEYRWLLPDRFFDFTGNQLDVLQWASAGVSQDDRLLVTGTGTWGQTYFYSLLTRVLRGGSVQGRVDTSVQGSAYAMVGLRSLDLASGNYGNLAHGLQFANGRIQVYEYGNYRGVFDPYTPGASYDFRVESKSAGGARYLVRPSGSAAAFQLVYESNAYTDPVMGVGADVYAGTFGFDDLLVSGRTLDGRQVTTSIGMGSPVTLQVVDHERQTNSSSVNVQPIKGSPPIAAIAAPASGPAALELSFSALGSTDDHGIAGYTWDFGDASAPAFGPLVTHRFDHAGAYRVTVTVTDYAGQTGSANTLVSVTDGHALAAVPWRIVDGIELPHETYPGKNVRLKAVARGVPIPFEYTWDFGDGSAPLAQTVSDAAPVYNLEAIHAYNGAENTPFTATVRVTLSDGTVLSDTYSLLLRPKNLDTEVNVAIDEGLWWLHQNQVRATGSDSIEYGSWRSYVAASASAVQAFGINGHIASGDASQDPYVDTVRRGVHYLMTHLTPWSIAPQAYGNPDGNGNGIGLSCNDGNDPYQTGPMMDALIASVSPEAVATAGGTWVKGRTYRDIMQDMVDMYAWGQTDADWGGGWRYSWNSDSDNSAAQWAAIGLLPAELYWGISAPAWVKERNLAWLNTSCCFGYGGGGDGEATTPSGLVQLAYDGIPTSHNLWKTAEDRVASRWSYTAFGHNLYAKYAIAKAFRTANPQPVQTLASTGKDWFRDPVDGFARTIVDRQYEPGFWTGSIYHDPEESHLDRYFGTAWSVIILTPSLFQMGPIAAIHFRPNPSAVGFPVTFNATASYHQHPSYRIAEYRWDFDASDGVDFDNPDAVGPIVTRSYPSIGTRTVTLQVRDNASPQHYDTESVEVHTTVPPFPPTADAGGPYVAATGEDVRFDGGGSFDIDEGLGDFIRTWDWEVDYQMPLDYADGVTGVRGIFVGGYPTAGKKDVSLRVTDATSLVFPELGIPDQTNVDFTTVQVYDRLIPDLRLRAKTNMVQLVWTKVGDYSSVQRSTNGPNHGFVEIGRAESTYATFLDQNVRTGVEYYYRVFAFQTGQLDPIGVSDAKFVVSQPRVVRNLPPRFVGSPPTTAYVGEAYDVTLHAMDPEGDPFAFRLLAGPAGFTVESATGAVHFVPTEDQLGSQPVSVEVSNDAGRGVLSYTLIVSPRPNRAPVAEANGPYATNAGQTVAFSSEGTADPDGQPLTYLWVFGDGTISDQPNPTHVYGAAGDYKVALYVNDSHGGTDRKFTTATIARLNRSPIADAGRQQRWPVGSLVTLDGSKSYDLDHDPLGFRWQIVTRPPDSQAVLDFANVARPTFRIDRAGIYEARLVVNDGFADSAAASVLLSTVNSAPLADPGPSLRIAEGLTAHLDGTRSSDVDGDPLHYRWSLLERPDGSDAALDDSTSPTPSFRVDRFGAYDLQLVVNDGTVDSAPALLRVTTGNLPPVLPPLADIPTQLTPGVPWTYPIPASDPDGTPLTFIPETIPDGMTVSPDGTLDWTPTESQTGEHPVIIQVVDDEGGSSELGFTVTVHPDGESPLVTLQLVQGDVQPNTGQWAARLGTTAAIRVAATDNVRVESIVLSLGGVNVALDPSGLGSVPADLAGLNEVVATATDPRGNVGSTSRSILFYDPNAPHTITASIISPVNGASAPGPTPVVISANGNADLVSYRLDYAPAADVDLGNISVESPQFTTLANVKLPAGTRTLDHVVAGQFDPTLLLNDEYVLRLVVSDGVSLTYEAALVSVSGNLKFGELRLEFTDLAVPLVGVPITISRVYDSRQASRSRDFGHGWSLGIQDAKIRKSLLEGGMYVGSRVYINTPDGRRVGFTTGYQPSSFFFAWIGSVILEPDPGVYEKLEILGNVAVNLGGRLRAGLGEDPYNPSGFRLTAKDGTVYTYDEGAGLQGVIDLNGNHLELTRDGIYHYPSGSTDPDQSIPFIRDAQGRITAIVDPNGKDLTYTYDAAGNLRTFANQMQETTRYIYSNTRAHFLTNIIDVLGRQALRMEYDASGRLTTLRDALGNPITQDFDLAEKTATFTDANGHPRIVRYDDNGNEVMKVIPGISTNYFAYDAHNNQIWHQDGRGFVRTRTYDTRGNLMEIVDALGSATVIAYNDFNKPTTVTDPLGHTTQFNYDAQGHLTNTINALGASATYTYDAQGRVSSATDFHGHTTFYDYVGGCSCGKPGMIVNPDGSFRSYEYNAWGQAIRETDELGDTTLSLYDDVGHLLRVLDAEGNATGFTYSGNLKTSQTDPLGRTTWYAHDGANRRIAVTNALGGVIRFQYDNGTNRTAVIDPLGNVTRYHYDAAGRLTHRIDPWNRTNIFAYDASGNRTETVDRNGRKRTFSYDASNRRTNEIWWNGTDIVRSMQFTFNGHGRMTSASDPSSRLRFTFDSLNRQNSVTQSSVSGMPDFTLMYDHDMRGHITAVRDNWGVEVLLSYDSRDNTTQRIWQGGTLPGASLRYAYDAVGRHTNVLRYADDAGNSPAGFSAYRYSPAGLVTSILHASVSGDQLAEYGFQADNARQTTQRLLNGQQSDYRYDLASQLVGAQYSDGQSNEEYSYDLNGNRLNAGTEVMTNNQLSADATFVYHYDFEGSLTSRSNTATGETTTYQHDHRNRLEGVVDIDAGGRVTQTVSFTYDALNRRIAKSVDGTETHFLLNQENAWADADGTGAITVRYLLGHRTDEMVARHRSGQEVEWYLTDNLGTVADVCTSSGSILNHRTYDTFGRIQTQTHPEVGDRFGFTGRELDSEIGLYYYRARYYDPRIGRFLSQDPACFKSDDWNLYRYVANDPINRTDPTGRFAIMSYGALLAGPELMIGPPAAALALCRAEGIEAGSGGPDAGYCDYFDFMRHCTWGCCAAKKVGELRAVYVWLLMAGFEATEVKENTEYPENALFDVVVSDLYGVFIASKMSMDCKSACNSLSGTVSGAYGGIFGGCGVPSK